MAFSVPALTQLLAEIDEMSPDRDRSADGWIGDPAHAARHSDHNPESDGSVDARDFTHDPAHGVDCNLLADQIKDDHRLKGGGYVIWNRRIWNPDISRSWRTYTGSNPHDHHMHVSVSDAGQNNRSPWLQEDELMGKADDILDKLEDIDKKVPGLKQQERDRNRITGIGKALRAIKEGRPIDDEILAAIEDD